MKKIAIYRCLFNDYDYFLKDLNIIPNADYFIFTDNKSLDVSPYKKILVESKERNPSLDNRNIKIKVPLELANYETTIYLDTNISIIGDINILINEFDSSKSEIGLFKHPYHNNLYDDVDLCIKANKANKETLKKEISFYKDLNLKIKDNFSDNSIIFRKKQSANMLKAMDFWMDLVLEFSGRDQLSLPIVRSKFDLNEHFFNFSPRTKKNSFFIVFPHKAHFSNSAILKWSKFYVRFIYRLMQRHYNFYKNTSK